MIILLTTLLYCRYVFAIALDEGLFGRHIFNRDDSGPNITQTGPPPPDGYKYCSRAYHSATVRGETLYMIGGELEYINTSSPSMYLPYSATDVWTLDLSKSFNCSDPPPYKRYPYPSYLPIRNCNGALWRDPGGGSDDAILYYGGERPGFSSIYNATVPAPAVYEYDTKKNEFVGWKSPAFIEGRSCGSYAQDNDGNGYYLGGLRGLISDPNFENPPMKTQDTLVKINLEDGGKRYDELDTGGIWKFGTNVGGNMVYIDSIGEKGILVAFGGISISPDVNWAWGLPTKGNYNAVNNIYVYDIDSKTWFSQKTSGAKLQSRAQDCAVVVKAQDNSSIQIYTYGGYNHDRLFDQAHVLSLPSFTWMPAGPVGTVGRFVMSCNVVGNRQMLVAGGRTGKIGLDGVMLSPWTCVPDQFYKVFDLTTHTWTNQYNASAEEYEVNSVLRTIIGGTSKGGATLLGPRGGWDDKRLGAIFEKYLTKSSNSSSPTSSSSPVPTASLNSTGPPSHTHPRAGVIAGATIGSVAFLALVLGSVWFFRFRDSHRPDAPYVPPAWMVNTTGRTPQAELPPTVPPSVAWAGVPTAAYRASVDAGGGQAPTNYSPATGADVAVGHITEASSPSTASRSPRADNSPYFAHGSSIHALGSETAPTSGLVRPQSQVAELSAVRTPMAELPLPSPGEMPVGTPAAGTNIRSIRDYLNAGGAGQTPATAPSPESGASGGTAYGITSSEGSTPGSGKVLLR